MFTKFNSQMRPERQILKQFGVHTILERMGGAGNPESTKIYDK